MSNIGKAAILVVIVLAIGAGLVVWKNKVGGHTSSSVSMNSISRQEIELLLADFAKTNPMILKRLQEDPDLKKKQLDNLKQLFAFASGAMHDGLADDPVNKQELANIKAEIEAVNYDRDQHSDQQGQMPPFGFITEQQMNDFWADQTPNAAGQTHEQEFQSFLDTKISLLKSGNPELADREISDEEKSQAKDIFAKVRIYAKEYEDKVASGEVKQDLIDRINLQVKLQQAQFLARAYTQSDKVKDELKVTDDDVKAYVAAHPELNAGDKKSKAQDILTRAKNGEDFAALAKENSEDPGSKDKGGLYEDVPKGRMVAPFETAALALQPGQIAPELVESNFGYHIIKLERAFGKKDGKGDDTYDVRHILISNMMKDPDTGRDVPVNDYVQNLLEDQKSKDLIAKLVAENNVSVPDDFTVPELTPEQLEKINNPKMNGGPMMQPGGPDGSAPPPPPAGKPGDKKPAPEKPEPKKPEPKK